MQSFQQNGAGVTFRATCNEDGTAINISSATSKSIIFTKPDCSTVTQAASFGSGTGQLEYTSVSGDFNLVGVWQWRPYVYFNESEFWYGHSVMFKVKSN